MASATESRAAAPRGSVYSVRGSAQRGGAYNSHIVSAGVFLMLGAAGVMNSWLVAFLLFCLAIAIKTDRRPWKVKVRPGAIPGQMILYLQVLFQAALNALPWYAFSFVLYLGTAPVISRYHLGVSSFVMLFTFYMVYRTFFLFRYLWVLTDRWDRAGHTFETHEANLKDQPSAIRHVIWGYFLGNIGLVVRCAAQWMIIGLFETLRQALGLDLTRVPALAPHLVTICVISVTIFLATFWPALQSAFLIYYRAHRSFHENPPLYDSIHGIHHKGVLPTVLDSGTISPLEFFITELAMPGVALVPNWWWAGFQVGLALFGHLPSHDANSKLWTGHHHLAHHRFLNVNFGLTSDADRRYGTIRGEN